MCMAKKKKGGGKKGKTKTERNILEEREARLGLEPLRGTNH